MYTRLVISPNIQRARHTTPENTTRHRHEGFNPLYDRNHFPQFIYSYATVLPIHHSILGPVELSRLARDLTGAATSVLWCRVQRIDLGEVRKRRGTLYQDR